MVKQRHIAIIPARGGSKRIPRKNIVPFHGRPLMAWTVSAALESGLFDRVLVSTDDPEIQAVALACGAEAPFLRLTAADDMAPASAATLAALDQAERHWGEGYDVVAQLMPNCPLRDAAAIRTALSAFQSGNGGFQISCTGYGWTNPWWAAELAPDGQPKALFPEQRLKRSQELPALYCPTGAIWLADAAALRQAGTFYGPGHRFQPLDFWSAVDIDTVEDLAMAAALAQARVVLEKV
ncbi:acylneuraminate cytidylyltransferase family protein [Ferrovibrio terrae]|uniref:acylneuraminate cytidylyltransferase family protein n=1 Tax=Ferrovibrio terrae TaxID=2594003 RepID=UPI003138023E